MARMDAMTTKMDAQYKEIQSRTEQSTPNLDDDDMPMSGEEEAKFMQSFYEGSKILHSIEETLLEDEIFSESDAFMEMTADEDYESESDNEEPPFEKIPINTNYKIKSSLEGPPTDLKLKPLVTNENDEIVPTRTVTSWRVCIDYRKLNEANAKDHFPLPFMDQMQMPFGLCNAPVTFQRCMLAIFQDMIKESVEVFMEDFTVFGDSFDKCLNNLDKMLQCCKDAHLVLNWEKCDFMVKEGIVLGHKVSSVGLEVDKEKIDVISKLPSPTNIKGVRSFLGHAGFYQHVIKDFLKFPIL
nr:reverse transcriptase domain-containing protein [Tanacetum cinerariifolium]